MLVEGGTITADPLIILWDANCVPIPTCLALINNYVASSSKSSSSSEFLGIILILGELVAWIIGVLKSSNFLDRFKWGVLTILSIYLALYYNLALSTNSWSMTSLSPNIFLGTIFYFGSSTMPHRPFISSISSGMFCSDDVRYSSASVSIIGSCYTLILLTKFVILNLLYFLTTLFLLPSDGF